MNALDFVAVWTSADTVLTALAAAEHEAVRGEVVEL